MIIKAWQIAEYRCHLTEAFDGVLSYQWWDKQGWHWRIELTIPSRLGGTVVSSRCLSLEPFGTSAAAEENMLEYLYSHMAMRPLL